MFFISDHSSLPLVSSLRKLKVGPPQDPDSNMGALISNEHLQKVKGYIEVAIQDGGTVVCGEGKERLDLPEKNKTVSPKGC